MICGVLTENQCNTPDMVKVSSYGWHNDAGLATQYKPVAVGNRMEGLGQDFVNENTEMVRKLSFAMQLSILMIMRVEMFNYWMRQVTSILFHGRRDVLFCFDSRTQHRVFKSHERNP